MTEHTEPTGARPAPEPAPSPSPRTARSLARAQVEADIVRVARAQLAQVGPGELSVRAVARELGMGSASIYRYVSSRDELLGRLLVAVYDELGQYVEDKEAEADEAWRARSMGRPQADAVLARWRAVCGAVRDWALAHPHDYALLYGSPVPGYQAPADTVPAASRVTACFVRCMVAVEQLGLFPRPVPPARGGDPLAAAREYVGVVSRGDRPPREAVLARGILAWTTVFGTVSFELFGHYAGGVDDTAAWFTQVTDLLAADLGIPV